MPRQHNQQRQQPQREAAAFEVEVIPGLEDIAGQELQRSLGRHMVREPIVREGLLPIRYAGERTALLGLATVLAVYERHHFAIPRPKALLGQSAFDTLLRAIETVRALHPRDAFQTLRISAAGEESSVLVRLREQLANATGLAYVAEEGNLLLRLRRPLDARKEATQGSDPGWEVLIRLSPRPLSARRWRVCNLPGALNASVAHAMALLTQPHADDVVLNLACGSASLLIERLAAASARIAVGCDMDGGALECARANVAASGADGIRLELWDAGALPTPDAWVDAVLADLPFGQLVGSHERNLELYPRILREAARVTVAGGLFAAITQDIRLWERLVADAAADWTLRQLLPIKLPFGGGHLRPRIYVLQRKGLDGHIF
ncbi:MAG: RNA methyltransferase [Chloroflexi bacterium]|nr:MAG: RNA methyltransferase [Chloroflexota bacterium]